MQRRVFLAAPGAALALAGCGFQLRQAPKFAFDSIFVGSAVNSSLASDLRRQIASGGQVQVVALGLPPDRAQAVFDLLQEQREKAVVGLNATGQVREFQLRIRVKFKLRTPQGKELIPETELLQTRDISFSETAALSKEAEENLLYRDMQSDLVQQIMRRLAAVKTI